MEAEHVVLGARAALVDEYVVLNPTLVFTWISGLALTSPSVGSVEVASSRPLRTWTLTRGAAAGALSNTWIDSEAGGPVPSSEQMTW